MKKEQSNRCYSERCSEKSAMVPDGQREESNIKERHEGRSVSEERQEGIETIINLRI